MNPPSKTLYPLLAVTFIGTLGFSLVLPFLVFLVTRFGGNAVIYGVLGATYPAFQLVGSSVLGKWSDAFGRKKILLLSQLGTLASWLIFLVALLLPVTVLAEVDVLVLGAFTLTLPLAVLFLARAFDGATGGNVAVANAYLADITPKQNRSANFGKLSAASNLGFIVGPALAGILGATQYGEILPVLAAIIISIVGTLLIVSFLPETHPAETASKNGGKKIRLQDALKLPNVAYVFGLYFLIFLGFTMFYTAFPIHAATALNWSITDLGLFLSVLSLLMVAVQTFGLAWASKRVDRSFLVVAGCLLLAGNFVLLSTNHVAFIYLAAVLFAVGNGIMWPSVLAVLSIAAGETYQGSVQGMANSFGSFASIIGLIVGGILYESLSSGVFLLSAGILTSVAVASIPLRRMDDPPKAALKPVRPKKVITRTVH